tara:strand:- start:60 stop:560 length:501 start_codon:yes stop_codon:yes gene_type:complete
MKTDKIILDACCGSRMFWFDKENKDVLFADIRTEIVEAKDSSCKIGYRTIRIEPDIEMDFRNMPFKNNTFKMVVFDPPHLNQLGKSSWLAKKYGVLLPTWELDIKSGFEECMRVLEPYGTLIFKWNANQITVNQILNAIGRQPLFGHKSGKQANTHWMAFLKQNNK